MKRIVILIMLLLPLLVQGQGSLYKRYASQPGLTVAQVSGFKLSDSERIDVVMLQADDDASWQRLLQRFGVDDANGETSWLADVDVPEQRTRWSGQPVLRVVVSHKKHTIGLYRLDTEAQYDALIDYQTAYMHGKHKPQGASNKR